MRNERLNTLHAYRATLHPMKCAEFDRKLHIAINAASASSNVADATERAQDTTCSLNVVQHRNARIRELQDQNERVLVNMVDALQTQKGSLTCAQTSIAQLQDASMVSGSDAEEGGYTTGKRSSSSAGLAHADEPCAKQMKEERQHTH